MEWALVGAVTELVISALKHPFVRWGLAGISIRPPALGPPSARKGGLYTRVLADSDTRDARVIGCHIATVDAQVSPEARPTASPPSPTTPATTPRTRPPALPRTP